MSQRTHTAVRVALAIVLMGLVIAPTAFAVEPTPELRTANASRYALRDVSGTFSAKYEGTETAEETNTYRGAVTYRLRSANGRYTRGFIGGTALGPPDYLAATTKGPVSLTEVGTYVFERPNELVTCQATARRRLQVFVGGETLGRIDRPRGIRVTWVNPLLTVAGRCPGRGGLPLRGLEPFDRNGLKAERATAKVVSVRRLLKRSSVYRLSGRKRITGKTYLGSGSADITWSLRFTLVRKGR